MWFIGDSVEAEKLLNQMKESGRLPHAFIFFGPRESGKGEVARRWAASFFCESKGSAACENCPSCRQVFSGSHPDVMFLSKTPGKKNIGIDEIRGTPPALSGGIRRFQLAPLGLYKFWVIEEAETLSLPAQQALLKTLEEPPPGGILILVSTSLFFFLPTVRSRCCQISFPKDASVPTAPHPFAARAISILNEGNEPALLALSQELSARKDREGALEFLRQISGEFRGSLPRLAAVEASRRQIQRNVHVGLALDVLFLTLLDENTIHHDSALLRQR